MVMPEVRRPEETSRQNGLEQAIDRYKQSTSFLTLSENTRSFYRADLAQLEGFLKTAGTLSLTTGINNWFDALKKKQFLQSTVNRKHSSLSGFLKWAQAEGVIRPDFTDGLSKYEKVKRRGCPKTLTAEQTSTLVSKARSLRDASLISIALSTGASITEIVNLNVEDILKTGNGNIAIRFKGLEKKAQPRKLVVDKRLGNEITEYIRRSKLKLEDPLFRGKYGYGRLTRTGVTAVIFKKYAQEIGVENLNPRMLRDTFIANFTGTPHELAKVLGRKV